MTISTSDNTPRISYSVSEGASQSSFAVPFEFFADADLNVYLDGTLKTISTHYSVSGGSGTTGSISMSVTGASGGSTVIITRGIALDRTTDFPTSGSFAIGTLNTELDRFVAIQADLNDTITRSVRLQDEDTAVSMELPLKADRVGAVLAFNASTGAAEAGPKITAVQSLSGITTSVNLLGTAAVVEDMGLLATSAVIEDMGLLATSANVTAMGLLGVSGVITDMGILGTAAIVEDMGILGTSANVTAMGLLGTAAVVEDMGLLSASAVITDMDLLATSANVTAMGVLGTSANVTAMAALSASAVVADMALLATTDVIADMALLANSDVISDLNTLATSDIVSDLNTLATSDIVSDINTLATSDIVSDLNTLATSDIVTDINLLATSAIVADLNLLATSDVIADMASLAGGGANPNITSVTASGAITAGSFVIGNADINENDLESIDGITAGTIAASKAAVVDANKDITGFRNITLTGELDAGSLDISGDIDVDGTANLDVVDIDGAVNMATTALVTGVLTTTAATVFNGGFAANASSTITLDDNDNNLTLTSTDADANSGPNLRFYRNSSSPADNDLMAKINFNGRNDNSQDVTYASIENYALDVSDGTEDGELTFYTITGGSLTNRLDFTNSQTVFNEGSIDVDFRVESNGNANMLFVDAGNDAVGIGTTNVDADNNFTVLGNFQSNFIRNVTSGNRGYNINIGGINGSGTHIIGASVTGEVDNGDATGQLAFKTRTSGSVTEKMRIDSSGKVGIGTSSPDGLLTILTGNSDTIPRLRFQHPSTTDDASIDTFQDANGTVLSIGTNSFLANNSAPTKFNTSNEAAMIRFFYDGIISFATCDASTDITERMSITKSGDLCVGTTSTLYGARAHFFKTGASTVILQTDTATEYSAVVLNSATSGNNGFMLFQTEGTPATRGSITYNRSSNVVAYNTTSDYRLKTDSQPITDATLRLKQLNPVNFKWIEDGTRIDGFLAHEVSSIVPEAVTGTKDEEDADGNPKYQGIDQSKLVPLLVKTIQELEARITALEG